MKPREFCRAMAGLHNATLQEILDTETTHGIRKQYLGYLSKALPVSRARINNWKTLDFVGMPDKYELILSQYWENHQLRLENRQLRRELNNLYVAA